MGQSKGKMDKYKIWSYVDSTVIKEVKYDIELPLRFKTLRLNINKAKIKLKPLEPTPLNKNEIRFEAKNDKTVRFPIPTPSGEFVETDVILSKIITPEMMKNYPDIRSYNAVSVNDSGFKARIDINPKGVFIMVTQAGESIFLKPLDEKAKVYICYYQSDIPPRENKFNEPAVIKGNQ